MSPNPRPNASRKPQRGAAEAAPAREGREERIYVRATASQRQALEQAAEATGKTLTAFVLDAACIEAERALIDRRLFQLDDAQWSRFTTVLERPVAKQPRLRRLLTTPGVLD